MIFFDHRSLFGKLDNLFDCAVFLMPREQSVLSVAHFDLVVVSLKFSVWGESVKNVDADLYTVSFHHFQERLQELGQLVWSILRVD